MEGMRTHSRERGRRRSLLSRCGYSLTGLALGLVLTAAVVHASWNFLAKRAAGGVAFLWLITFVSSVVYAPLAIIVIVRERPTLLAPEWLFIIGSAVLHAAYFLTLQRGYRSGDLSVVYPLARGTGPMFSAFVAIAVLGERPGPIALVGIALVGVGVFVLSDGLRVFRDSGGRAGALFGIGTGVIIASYTLWDSHAVSVLLIPPSYILVLTALVFTPVSYIAPAREISIVIGTAMGARLLSEPAGPRRIAAASVVVLGVVALALG